MATVHRKEQDHYYSLPLYIFRSKDYNDIGSRRASEISLFHIKSDVPPCGKRVLTLLENALLKTKLIASLPRLCQLVLEGEHPELEHVLGSKCTQALAHLVRLQMVWNESKSGRMPRSWSTRILVMEKRPSDKSVLGRRRLIGKAETEDGRRQLQPDKTNNETTFGLKIPTNTTTKTTTTTTAGSSSSSRPRRSRNAVLLRTEPPPATKTEQGRRGIIIVPFQHEDEDQEGIKLLKKSRIGSSREIRRREKKEDRVISLAEKDASSLTFLSDLLAWGRDATSRAEHEAQLIRKSNTIAVDEGSSGVKGSSGTTPELKEEEMDAEKSIHHHLRLLKEAEQLDDDDALLFLSSPKKVKTSCQVEEDGSNSNAPAPLSARAHKVNILGLIRAALTSKYGDHVKKALKEKDLKSLFCILSLLPQTTPTLMTSFIWNSQQQSRPATTATTTTTTAPSLTHHSKKLQKKRSPGVINAFSASQHEHVQVEQQQQQHPPQLQRLMRGKQHKSTCRQYVQESKGVSAHPAQSSRAVEEPTRGNRDRSDAPHDSSNPSPITHTRGLLVREQENKLLNGSELEQQQQQQQAHTPPPPSQPRDDFNFESLFRENHSSSDGEDEDSLDSDTNIQDEIWGILRRERRGAGGDNLIHDHTTTEEGNPGEQVLLVGEQGDEHDEVDTHYMVMDATDDIETDLASRFNLIEEGTGSYPATRTSSGETTETITSSSSSSESVTSLTCRIVKLPYLSSSSLDPTDLESSSSGSGEDERHGLIIIPDEAITFPDTPYLLQQERIIKRKGLTRQRLSTHPETTEDSGSGAGGGAKPLGPLPHAEPKEPLPAPSFTETTEVQGTGVTTRIVRAEDVEDAKKFESFLKQELTRTYQHVLNLLTSNGPALDWIESNLLDQGSQQGGGRTTGLRLFTSYLQALTQLMCFRLGTSLEEDLARKKGMVERWKSERRHLIQLKELQGELKAEKNKQIPRLLTLDFQIRILNSRLRKISKEMFQDIRQVVRDTELNSAILVKAEMGNLEKNEKLLQVAQEECELLKKQVVSSVEKLHNFKQELNEKLRKNIEDYDNTIVKLQTDLDDTIKETSVYKEKVKRIQEYYKDVESRFIDMCAERKLKQIMRNIEMADDFKRNRAAKMIQDYWRRYKIRKRKRERKKGKKGGKKKGGAAGTKKKDGAAGRDSESPPSRAEKSKTPSANKKPASAPKK